MYLYVLAALCIVFTIILGLSNTDILNITIYKTQKIFHLSFWMICALSFILGALASFFVMLKFLFNIKKNQKQLKRKFEKTSIGADDSELKVKTLENKIKTLEVALEKTLKNNNQ